MTDSKHHISRSLESAKVWIDQAEESFDQDSDVRGELNLFLAQAELQRVREVNRSRRWRWKYPLFRHVAACALAVVAVLGGFYWWDGQRSGQQPVPVSPKQQQQQAAVEQAVTQVMPPARPSAAVNSIVVQEASDPDSTKPLPVRQPSSAEANRTNPDNEVRLTPNEMQQLIRAAGKSLRGQ